MLKRHNLSFIFFLVFALNFAFTLSNLAGEGPNVLLIGAELKDLEKNEREKLTHYTLVERPFMSADKVKDLVKQTKPAKVIIRQSSGGIYEYKPDGTLIGEVGFNNMKRQEFLDERQNKPLNVPKKIKESNMPPQMNAGMTYPVQINGQMTILPSGESNISAAQMRFQGNTEQMHQTEGMTGRSRMNNYPQTQRGYAPIMPQRRPMIYQNQQSGASMRNCSPGNQPMMAHNNMPQSFPSEAYRGVAPFQAGMNSPKRIVPPNISRNSQRPMPGENVPPYLFPGGAQYTYLPGEGDALPPPGYSLARQTLKQAATLVQNNAYPFWFDNYLTTDTSFATSQAGTDAGFPNLRFNANSTANFAVVGSQLLGVGTGLAATVTDSLLEGAELKARREAAEAYARGTANYYYPDAARTSYPALPYQPIPAIPYYY